MDGKQLILRLELSNFLSYGEPGAVIDLLPLNVLIGPNGSGKSNLIEALSILRSTPSDLAAAIREGGGISEYLYKGHNSLGAAGISVAVRYPGLLTDVQPLNYHIGLRSSGPRVELLSEIIETRPLELGTGDTIDGSKFYRFSRRKAEILQNVPHADNAPGGNVRQEIPLADLVSGQSILAQRKDPYVYPELTWLSAQFGSIAIYREWMFGQRARVRLPEPTDLPTDFLLPDSSNLALVLHDLLQRSPTRTKLIEYLQRFYSSAQHIATRINAGTVQLYIDEGMDELVPASRLSDGTLRYLSLLAILLHPSPPPLVCIEEPELGLHPDILPTIGELLVDASQRTQLVVTTHSDALVSALSEVPESIVVCEPGENGSQLRRLDRAALGEWLSRYSLGEMWRMGEIGGTRW
jgi:predicted ATPase